MALQQYSYSNANNSSDGGPFVEESFAFHLVEQSASMT